MNKAIKMLLLRDRSRQGDPQRQNEPRQEYRRPEQEYRRPEQEYRRPEQEYRRPEQENRRPEQEYRRPEQENRRPEQENRRPEQSRYGFNPTHIPRQEYNLYGEDPQRQNEPRQERPPYWDETWRKGYEGRPESMEGYPEEDEIDSWGNPQSRMVGFGYRDAESRRRRTRTGRFKRARSGPDDEEDDEQEESGQQMGHGGVMNIPRKLDEKTAQEWLNNMKNEDGSTGPHWTMEQAKQIATQRSISHDPVEFWAALNVVYSDYCGVAKKANANNLDFYVWLACAFLDDEDAKPGKMMRYYQCIVK